MPVWKDNEKQYQKDYFIKNKKSLMEKQKERYKVNAVRKKLKDEDYRKLVIKTLDEFK